MIKTKKAYARHVVLILCLLSLYTSVTGQVEDPLTAEDTVIIISEDTVMMRSHAARYNPQKSLLLAAIVPGLGQVYNRKYWKLPLVYGGFAAVGWNIDRYQDAHVNYRRQLFENLELGLGNDNDLNPTTGLSTRQLRGAVQKTQRGRDFWILMVGAMYVLQIVDAHVDSHLKEFDVNPNLRVSMTPTFDQDAVIGRNTGMTLTLKF